MEKNILEFNVINIRDYSLDKHKKADDYPFGGGVGMVMTVQPIFDAIKSIENRKGPAIYMSPRGKIINQEIVENLSKEEEVTILCGHYEGVDQRALDCFQMEELSIGDYILTGGELAAMVLIDAVARFVPSVLGNEISAVDESIYSGLLEHNQYTKPREYEGMNVPEVLLNGNHKLIHLHQFEESLRLTKYNRPELMEKFIESCQGLSKDEKKVLENVIKSTI